MLRVIAALVIMSVESPHKYSKTNVCVCVCESEILCLSVDNRHHMFRVISEFWQLQFM